LVFEQRLKMVTRNMLEFVNTVEPLRKP